MRNYLIVISDICSKKILIQISDIQRHNSVLSKVPKRH